MNRVLPFDKSEDRYIKLADKRIEEENYVGALALLFSAMEKSSNCEIFDKIAFIYNELDQYELSNKYYFKYMHFAPKEKVSRCYEKIAINLYNLNNLWGATYYLHKKFTADGRISGGATNEEILDIVFGDENKEPRFRVVYPYDKADYNSEIERARQAISMNDFKSSITLFESVPIECLDEDALNDFSIAYMMVDDYESAEKVARISIKKYGENLGAFCNLSTIAQMKNDAGSCEYYYNKAMELRTDEQGEYYKILNPAIEMNDHKTIKLCLGKILTEKPYDLTIRFFLGIALINMHEYDKAYNELVLTYQYNPKDYVVEYYIDFIKSIKNGNSEKEKLLPIPYLRKLPKKVVKQYESKIKNLIKAPEKILQEIRKKQVKKLINWGLTAREASDATMRTCAMILSIADEKLFNEIALEIFLDSEVQSETKRILVYALLLKGYKGKIAFVSNIYYVEVALKKLTLDESENSSIYLSSYALCASRVIFCGISDLTKMVKATKNLYKKFGKTITSAEIDNEELAALILLHSGYDNFKNEKEIATLFEISLNKLKKLKKLTQIVVEEQNNDKDN